MPNGEVSTRPVVLRSLDQGKTVFVPYLYQNSTGQQPRMLMDMVALHSREDYEALLPDSWGIPSLPKDSIPNRIRCLGDVTEANARTDEEDFNSLDLVVMPGVAFDNECQRLGHGKGFYDFFLARYHKRIGAPKGQMPFLGKQHRHNKDRAEPFPQSVLDFNNKFWAPTKKSRRIRQTCRSMRSLLAMARFIDHEYHRPQTSSTHSTGYLSRLFATAPVTSYTRSLHARNVLQRWAACRPPFHKLLQSLNQ